MAHGNAASMTQFRMDGGTALPCGVIAV